MKKRFAFTLAVLLLCGIAEMSAQPMAVELEFSSADTINLVAGDSVCFRLVAKDSLGNVVTNWNSVGSHTIVTVRNSIAESDTMVRSWSRHADGYTWQRLTVEGSTPTRISRYQYSIDPAIFVDGVVHACYTSTAAERNIRLEVSKSAHWATQLSPPINIVPAKLDNFLLDITSQAMTPATTFVLRPFEIVVVPRDRYLNHIHETVKTRFTSRYPAEFTALPGLSDIFVGDLYINGITNFFIMPNTVRQDQMPQAVSCTAADDPDVSGESDPIWVLPHPPADFSLQLPADQHTLSLTSRTDVISFTWQRPTPPDPYSNMQVSRFDPATYSDTVHYHIHFLDSAMTREVILDANGMGRSATFTMTQYDLGLLVNHLAGRAVKSAEIIWFVEATDGDFTTASRPVSPTMTGHRLRIDNHLFVNRGVVFDPWSISSTDVPVGGDISIGLHPVNSGFIGGSQIIKTVAASGTPQPAAGSPVLSQNYPNPFNPSTTIRYSTTKRGLVSLKVYDLLGGEVATIHQGMLDAGEHTASFDASALRSGVYVYRLEAEGKSMSRRMVVMK